MDGWKDDGSTRFLPTFRNLPEGAKMHIQLYISNVPGLLKCFIALIIDIAIYKIHPGNFNLEVAPALDNNIPPFI